MGQLKANKKEVVHEKEGNIVVINTCGFIKNAKEESINTILDYVNKKKIGEVDKVYVTGYQEIPDVDQYFGTTDMPNLLKELGADYLHELVGERLATTPKNYAYLKISEGCDRTCSFCAIPLMRGKHKSRSIDEIIIEAKKLAQKGVQELILIAQDLTFYGLDIYKKRNLSELLKSLVKVDGIQWIRLHYAFPSGFPLDVLDIIAKEKKICNYLDIPLQHISEKILKSMRRGGSKEKTNSLINKIRTKVPGIAIRTTLIVGYPGETEEDFNLLKDWVKEMQFERLGCFTYSHEENTHAYNLTDNVPDEVKRKRANEIMEVQSGISWKLNRDKIGKEFNVIIDRKSGNYYLGRTEFDSPDVDNEVLIDARTNYLKVGEFVKAKIIDASDFDLYAEVIK